MGGTFLLRIVDGLLHIADSLLQRLSDTRHRLCVLLLQFRGTGLKQLLGHVLEALLMSFQFLVHLLAYQFQFPTLALRLGIELFVLRLQMLYPTVGSV